MTEKELNLKKRWTIFVVGGVTLGVVLLVSVTTLFYNASKSEKLNLPPDSFSNLDHLQTFETLNIVDGGNSQVTNENIMYATNSEGMSPDEFTNLFVSPKQFNKYTYNFPCINRSSHKKEAHGGGGGLHYVKVHKTASSTIAHVTNQIAKNHGKNCLYYNSHSEAYHFDNLKKRNRPHNNVKGTFLFTVVREPTKRAISDFYWRPVSQEGLEVNLENFRNRCCRSSKKLNGESGYQLAFISNDERLPEYTFWNQTISREKVQRPSLLLERINDVFDSYDFVGVTERLDESLVALSFLLNLPLIDVTYVNFKHGSNGDYVGIRKGNQKRCLKIQKSEPPREIEEYIKSTEWKARVAGDVVLHKSANAALDNTIDNVIGRKEFERQLSTFKVIQEQLLIKCDISCNPCTSDGKYIGTPKCKSCVKHVLKDWQLQESG